MRRLASMVLFAFVITLGAKIEDGHASPPQSSALLVAQGKQREAEGDELSALKRYGDAITIDPTNEDAYMALGALRTKRGELLEAEEVYAVAIARIPGSLDARVARGKVRRLRGKLQLAQDDLRMALAMVGHPGNAREVFVLREWIALERDLAEHPAMLAAFRRLLVIGRATSDDALVKEASVQARALGLYVGEIDPVLGGPTLDLGAARRSLASIARRGG